MADQKPGYIKSLQLIHGALLTGQIVFAAVGYYLMNQAYFTTPVLSPEIIKYLQVALYAFCIIVTYFSFFIYKRKINILRSAALPREEILNNYRAANLVRWAMLEGPVLFLIIHMMLFNEQLSAVFILLILTIFILSRPTAAKLENETGVSEA